MTNVLTMGSFDILHPGHLGLLARCRRMAGNTGQVVVAVNTDEFMARFKRPPIFTLEERTIMLEATRYVDLVVPNDGEHQPEIIHEYLGHGWPGILVIGDDWADRDYLAQIGLGDDRTFFERHGIELAYVPRTGSWSTTEVRQRLSIHSKTDRNTK